MRRVVKCSFQVLRRDDPEYDLLRNVFGPLPQSWLLRSSDREPTISITSSAEAAVKISLPGSKKISNPIQWSLMMAVPQAAASKRRTLGEKPALTIGPRVKFKVNRC